METGSFRPSFVFVADLDSKEEVSKVCVAALRKRLGRHATWQTRAGGKSMRGSVCVCVRLCVGGVGGEKKLKR
jgi:hypothetical protein